MLRHIVMYKFKPETTSAQIEDVIEAFSGLPQKIHTIIGLESGTSVSKQGMSEGSATFSWSRSYEQDLADYLAHPAHAALVQVVRGKREKVVVFDYWATK